MRVTLNSYQWSRVVERINAQLSKDKDAVVVVDNDCILVLTTEDTVDLLEYGKSV